MNYCSSMNINFLQHFKKILQKISQRILGSYEINVSVWRNFGYTTDFASNKVMNFFFQLRLYIIKNQPLKIIYYFSLQFCKRFFHSKNNFPGKHFFCCIIFFDAELFWIYKNRDSIWKNYLSIFYGKYVKI